MTDNDAIRERVAAIHGFEHQHTPDTWGSFANTLAELDENGNWNFWDMKAPYSTAACEFIAHAPADIRFLLTENERLEAENAALRERLAAAEGALKPFTVNAHLFEGASVFDHAYVMVSDEIDYTPGTPVIRVGAILGAVEVLAKQQPAADADGQEG